MATIRSGKVQQSALAICVVLLLSIQGLADDTNNFIVPVSAAVQDASLELETNLLLASTEANLVSTDCESYCDAGDRPGLLFGDALHGNDWITAQYVYTGEVFNNTRGGLTTNNATRYTGRFDMVLGADLAARCIAPGGRLFFHFQSLYGEGITDNVVGVHQRISNMDGNPGAGFNFSQLTQYWWEKDIVEGVFTVRLGKILADSEFAIATRGGDFINTSLGWTHTIPVLPAYPNSSAAVIGFLQLNDQLELKAGIWDGAPDGGNWGFSGTGEIFAIGQLTANYTLGCNDLPGDTHIGAWNHNGTFADQGGGADHGANYGVYWGMSQLLKRECPCDDEQGLGAFGQWGWAPEDRNEAKQYWGAGLVYTGLLRGRDADTIGIGVGNMSFGDRIPGTQDETMIELFYKARLGPHVVLQPDFQYFSNPRSGETTNADSFVVGLRFQIVL